MEEKSTKRMNPQHSRYYSNEFRYLVVNDLLCTGDSVVDVAKRYKIGCVTLYKWLSIFGVETPSNNLVNEEGMSKSEKELRRELLELKRENSRLKVAKRTAELDALFHKTLLEKVAEKHNIDIKKRAI
ncbi:transposase [Porphyromonadaceae bacterium W3.11]|nr:transposase [Porphyromonadaceae bacterium W3.11]